MEILEASECNSHPPPPQHNILVLSGFTPLRIRPSVNKGLYSLLVTVLCNMSKSRLLFQKLPFHHFQILTHERYSPVVIWESAEEVHLTLLWIHKSSKIINQSVRQSFRVQQLPPLLHVPCRGVRLPPLDVCCLLCLTEGNSHVWRRFKMLYCTVAIGTPSYAFISNKFKTKLITFWREPPEPLNLAILVLFPEIIRSRTELLNPGEHSPAASCCQSLCNIVSILVTY